MNMSRNIFSNIFGGKKKQKQNNEDENIKPPDRRLSISKSGRMKEANKRRQTVTDGVFPPTQIENSELKSEHTQRHINSNKIETNTRKPSISDEELELDIDDVIREIQQTAL